MSNNVYCSAPWTGFTVREDGHVRTCCSGGISLGNLNETSIYDIQRSSKLKQIQEKMLTGQADPENCKNCINSEKESGLSSLRQHYLRYYPTFDSDTIELRNLDIRWNNSCNLGCMYCGPQASSTWSDRLSIPIAKPVRSYHDELLDFILEKIDQVEELTLVGGEPMLMKQNYQLLAQLPKTTKLSIITNLSYNLERLPCVHDLLDRPAENTFWNISCENIFEQFEYVRSGAKWDEFEKNLKFINKHWPGIASVSMVYSMFSAFDLVGVIEKFHSLGIKKFMLQPYFSNAAGDTMNVFKMPGAIQSKALEQLEAASEMHYQMIHPEDRDLYPIQNIDLLLDQLNKNQIASSEISKSEFLNSLQNYDKWNSIEFKTLWPHVIDLIESHLD